MAKDSETRQEMQEREALAEKHKLEARPKRRFILRDGIHQDENKTYEPGEIIETDDDLTKWPEKFTLIDDKTGLPAGVTPVTAATTPAAGAINPNAGKRTTP